MDWIMLILGVLLLIAGILTRTKKYLGFHQGLYHAVNVDKFSRFMGDMDMIVGIIFIVFFVLAYKGLTIFRICFLIITVAYILLSRFAESKFNNE